MSTCKKNAQRSGIPRRPLLKNFFVPTVNSIGEEVFENVSQIVPAPQFDSKEPVVRNPKLGPQGELSSFVPFVRMCVFCQVWL